MSKPKALTLGDLHVDYMSVLSTQSSTHDTDDMMFTIITELEKIEGVDWEFDEYGNLYVIKGKSQTYPAFVCHTDTVHMRHDGFEVHNRNDEFFYASCTDRGEFSQVGVGGDDKCGIIACLELLHIRKDVKCAFFLDEEKGCLGSAKAHLEFFSDCRFAIQVDRMNGGDIIVEGLGTELCSSEFKTLLNEVGGTYGYKSTTGKSTDVVTLKKRGLGISVVNLSAGYYNPHQKAEYINIPEFLNCIQFCIAIGRFKTVFPHAYVEKKYSNPASTGSGGYSHVTRGKGKKWPEGIAKNAKPECVECGKGLAPFEVDARVHEACMLALLSEIPDYSKRLLNVDPDGVRTLEVDEDLEDTLSPHGTPKLPQKYREFLPSDKCLLCDVIVVHEYEKTRGYCDSCRVCECGQPFVDQIELAGKRCFKCNLSDGNEVCSTMGCAAVLTSTEELIDGICIDCIEEFRLMRGI